MADNCKIKDLDMASGRQAFRHYRRLTHGDLPLWRVLRNELLVLFFSNLPGLLGIALRRLFYPCMFKSCGGKAVFGRSLTLRHAHKITLGRGCIIDDFALLDAKGGTNTGIVLGDGVYVGRQSSVYCKNGAITLGDRVNLSAHCALFSSNRLTVGQGCMIGAYCYFLSGGEYDYRDTTPFAKQSGMGTQGELSIGGDCWFGARVTVLDAASIGGRSVIGAGSVVVKPLPGHCLAVGVPARVLREI
jgi:acetyltransferase-like isoleucine patch superfamily enzyme